MEGSRRVGRKWLFSLPCLVFTLLLSISAFANPPQGKGHGHGKGKKVVRVYDSPGWRSRNEANWRYQRRRSKKELKFINGHDARDGRWDGRGPKVRIRRSPPSRRLR